MSQTGRGLIHTLDPLRPYLVPRWANYFDGFNA